jgi:hypothetical protein
MGTTVTNPNFIPEEIKRRLNFCNACYHSVYVSSRLLYGCETCSLALRKEHRLRVFENRVLRRIIEPKRDEMTGGWRKLYNVE